MSVAALSGTVLRTMSIPTPSNGARFARFGKQHRGTSGQREAGANALAKRGPARLKALRARSSAGDDLDREAFCVPRPRGRARARARERPERSHRAVGQETVEPDDGWRGTDERSKRSEARGQRRGLEAACGGR